MSYKKFIINHVERIPFKEYTEPYEWYLFSDVLFEVSDTVIKELGSEQFKQFKYNGYVYRGKQPIIINGVFSHFAKFERAEIQDNYIRVLYDQFTKNIEMLEKISDAKIAVSLNELSEIITVNKGDYSKPYFCFEDMTVVILDEKNNELAEMAKLQLKDVSGNKIREICGHCGSLVSETLINY